jgi:hypothetical protein
MGKDECRIKTIIQISKITIGQKNIAIGYEKTTIGSRKTMIG